MKPSIVFSDVDGTLLDSKKQVLPSTKASVGSLAEQGIPFVIISGRYPAGIAPIQNDLGVECPIICYGGSFMLDEKKNVLWSLGIKKDDAREVLEFVDRCGFPCAYNIYSEFRWIVKDKSHWMVKREESIVHAESEQGSIDSLSDTELVSKILFICDPAYTETIERALKGMFPDLSICRSSSILVEVMAQGVSKGLGVKKACELLDHRVENAAAFGDHFNDLEMLETVGMPFLMGNAPAELKAKFQNITDDNDHDGIAHALKGIGLL